MPPVTPVTPVTLLKKRLWHRCFPVIFVKFLRTPFLQNTCGRLLLTIVASAGLLVYFKQFYLFFQVRKEQEKERQKLQEEEMKKQDEDKRKQLNETRKKKEK